LAEHFVFLVDPILEFIRMSFRFLNATKGLLSRSFCTEHLVESVSKSQYVLMILPILGKVGLYSTTQGITLSSFVLLYVHRASSCVRH
jgi:hypothetical protein